MFMVSVVETCWDSSGTMSRCFLSYQGCLKPFMVPALWIPRGFREDPGNLMMIFPVANHLMGLEIFNMGLEICQPQFLTVFPIDFTSCQRKARLTCTPLLLRVRHRATATCWNPWSALAAMVDL